MRLKCNPTKLPSPYMPKGFSAVLPVTEAKETGETQDGTGETQDKETKKRDWSSVKRGKYGSGFWWTEAQDAVLREMRAQGKSFSEIAEHLGRSKAAVQKRAKFKFIT